MGKNLKPLDGYDQGGSICNFPVFHDGTSTPVKSPIATGAAKTLKVLPTGLRLHLISADDESTVNISKGGTADATATVTIPADTELVFECGGMNNTDGVGPDEFKVTPGTGNVSFWFDCSTPDGK